MYEGAVSRLTEAIQQFLMSFGNRSFPLASNGGKVGKTRSESSALKRCNVEWLLKGLLKALNGVCSKQSAVNKLMSIAERKPRVFVTFRSIEPNTVWLQRR